jgi:nicotinamidase-related amidase
MTRQRSPALLQRDRSALVVIDMQERLMPAIADADAVTRAAGILIEASRQLEVPVVVTEQYPKGLGPTVDAIASRLPNGAAVVEKMTFSAARNLDFASRIDELRAAGRDHIVLCGVESHVCVMQTAADLGAEGCTVHIVADACSSRAPASKGGRAGAVRGVGDLPRDHRDGAVRMVGGRRHAGIQGRLPPRQVVRGA